MFDIDIFWNFILSKEVLFFFIGGLAANFYDRIIDWVLSKIPTTKIKSVVSKWILKFVNRALPAVIFLSVLFYFYNKKMYEILTLTKDITRIEVAVISIMSVLYFIILGLILIVSMEYIFMVIKEFTGKEFRNAKAIRLSYFDKGDFNKSRIHIPENNKDAIPTGQSISNKISILHKGTTWKYNKEKHIVDSLPYCPNHGVQLVEKTDYREEGYEVINVLIHYCPVENCSVNFRYDNDDFMLIVDEATALLKHKAGD